MTSVSLAERNRWPARGELAAQLAIVVEHAVVRDPDRAVLVGHRLVATGSQVDDREPAIAEADAVTRVPALVVGAAMAHGVRHAQQLGLLDPAT